MMNAKDTEDDGSDSDSGGESDSDAINSDSDVVDSAKQSCGEDESDEESESGEDVNFFKDMDSEFDSMELTKLLDLVEGKNEMESQTDEVADLGAEVDATQLIKSLNLVEDDKRMKQQPNGVADLEAEANVTQLTKSLNLETNEKRMEAQLNEVADLDAEVDSTQFTKSLNLEADEKRMETKTNGDADLEAEMISTQLIKSTILETDEKRMETQINGDADLVADVDAMHLTKSTNLEADEKPIKQQTNGVTDLVADGDTKRQISRYLHHYVGTFQKGHLLKGARDELLFQDSIDGEFFLIDGDSLLLEATETKSWKNGQQLHLFSIVELYLKQFYDHGANFQIVFFQDFERFWSYSGQMLFLRRALIKHLTENCSVRVHTEWQSFLSAEWIQMLSEEHPIFIMIHNGLVQHQAFFTALKAMMYCCLGNKLSVVYAESVYVESSNMYATFLRHTASHNTLMSANRSYLIQAWRLAKASCPKKMQCVDRMENFKSVDIKSLKDHLLITSLLHYWHDIEDKDAKAAFRLYHWCLYFAILSTNTLNERLQFSPRKKDEIPSDKQNELSLLVTYLYQTLILDLPLKSFNDPHSVCDLLDESVFFKILTEDHLEVTMEAKNKYSELMGLGLENGLPCDSSPFIFDIAEDQPQLQEVESSFAALENKIVEQYAGEGVSNLKSLHIPLNEVELAAFASGKDFDEKYHWHCLKPLKDDLDLKAAKPISTVPFLRDKQLKANQKYMDYLQMYGETLGLGETSQRLIIYDPKKSTHTREKQPNFNKKEKKDKKSKKELIIEENTRKRNDEEKDRLKEKWDRQRQDIEKIQNPETAISEIKKFISKGGNTDLKEPHLMLMSWQYDVWNASNEKGTPSFPVAAELVHTLHQFLHKGRNPSPHLIKDVTKYLMRLGFDEIAAKISKLHLKEKEKLIVKRKCPVGIPYQTFQMQHMGHLMKRNEASDPDPRVTGFIPDAWQKHLLDAVDKNESALIVAPTSSGKTFCSYYCMEKILRESDTGIVVYVAPTKALVNQVVATVVGRFKKNMPPGKCLSGTFTRDYQHQALNCQILVTVPECLEILLLSPKRQEWASRLRYVIFDEVHCLGGEIGGEVWEHLLTLVRCPFLALSATVSNPKFFHGWLDIVRKFKESQDDSSSKSGKKVNLVTYSERYSDIETTVYFSQQKEVVRIHPCSYLDPVFLVRNGFPSGFSLSPRESFELWKSAQAMTKQYSGKADFFDGFEPEKFFGDNLLITKKEAREYEVKLKSRIEEFMREIPQSGTSLVRAFRQTIPHQIEATDSLKHFEIVGVSENEFDVYKNFPILIDKLKHENKLPAVVFMCDRAGIEALSDSLLQHVLGKVKQIENTDRMKQLQSKMSELKSIEKKDSKKSQAGTKVKSKKGEKGEKGEGREDTEGRSNDENKTEGSQAEQEYLAYEREYDDKKSSCGYSEKRNVSNDFLDKVFEKTSSKMTKKLKFGIGFHHAGCGKKDRQGVEMLFRAGYAQVVVATGTLALGIHMPCKTVVFVGNDLYVDALAYRQMSGRSGRRGFDNIGNVVFYGVPIPKICHLMKADVTKLKGRFPMSCTLVLRLLLFASNSNDLEDAFQKVMVVLNHPFMSHDSLLSKQQLQFYFLFSCELLIRQGLIDVKGAAQGLAGLVTHLFYKEPGNMVLVYFLRLGIFHDICKPTNAKGEQRIHHGYTCQVCSMSPIVGKRYRCNACYYEYNICENCFGMSTKAEHRRGRDIHGRGDFVGENPKLKYVYSEETLRLLVCILSHIFTNKRVPSFKLTKNNAGKKVLIVPPKRGSKVILDPMPPQFQSALSSFNVEVSAIFRSYLQCLSKQMLLSQGLPLSQASVLPIKADEVNASCIAPLSRLSGCTNEDIESYCTEAKELDKMMPREILIRGNLIPTIDENQVRNSYALDFFKHQSKRALTEDNCLKSGEIYEHLNEFMLTIMSIATSLEQLGPEDDEDHVIWAFKHLAFEYRDRFNSGFPGQKLPDW